MLFKLIVLLFFVQKTISTNSCPTIISRDEWGARSPIEIEYIIKPVEYVVIHHTVSQECTTKQQCIDRVLNIQAFCMEDLEYNDIGYNFLIGSDGNIYEGTGWTTLGAHTYGYNKKSIGIAFIGNFDNKLPPPAALQAAQKLIECAVHSRELQNNYKLIGGRQVIQTLSPGLHLYRKIKTWRNWVAKP